MGLKCINETLAVFKINKNITDSNMYHIKQYMTVINNNVSYLIGKNS